MEDAYYSETPRVRQIYKNWSVRKFWRVIPLWFITYLPTLELLDVLQRDDCITPQVLRRLGSQTEALPPFPPGLIRPQTGWQSQICMN